MKGECYINNKDAYTEWGIIFGETSFTALLTPAPLKNYIVNKSGANHGVQIVDTPPVVDERNLQLTFGIKANNLSDFLVKYGSFVTELESGTIDLRTKYQPTVIYHLRYLSCQQFQQYNGRLGKFVIKFVEPNPKNRT